MGRVTETPLSVVDFVAIQNLVGKYQWLVDEGDCDGWADLFTDDGVFASAFIPPKNGRDRLKEVPAETIPYFMRHQTGSMHMAYGATRDEVFVKYYSFVTTWKPGEGGKFFCLALYPMHLVRIDGAWKIRAATPEVIGVAQ